MDMMNMMRAIQNPQQYVMQQFMAQAVKEHPNEWQQCKSMFDGKSHAEQVKSLRKFYKDKDMDLDTVAKQYGVKL